MWFVGSSRWVLVQFPSFCSLSLSRTRSRHVLRSPLTSLRLQWPISSHVTFFATAESVRSEAVLPTSLSLALSLRS